MPKGALQGVVQSATTNLFSGEIVGFSGNVKATFSEQAIEDQEGNPVTSPGGCEGSVCDYDDDGSGAGATNIISYGATVEVTGSITEQDTKRAIVRLASKLGEDNGTSNAQVIITKI